MLVKSGHAQDVAFSSKVLERRSIRHPARVAKGDFIRNFRECKVKSVRHRCWSSRHKMPKQYAKIMDRKTWPTISETWLRRRTAAWAWVQVGSTLPGAGALDSAASSQLVKSEAILLKDGRECLVSLGNAYWAFLAWPLDVLDTTQDGHRTMSLRSYPPGGPVSVCDVSFERPSAGRYRGLELAE